MKSGNVINYSIRVAKNIERKMIKDSLVRLFSFCNTKKYQYIGFGSKYFTDFILFHKYLHIEKMVSIEADVGSKEKYIFNKPLKCIDLKFGLASEVIPFLSFDNPSVVWLDYDGLLETSYLKDMSEVVSKVQDGSVVMISYNSKPIKASTLEGFSPECNELELVKNSVKDRIDDKYIDWNESFKGFGKWDRYSSFLRTTVINAIKNELSIKNRGLSVEDSYLFKQIFNFNYKDGVEMSTLGFVIYKASSKEKLEACQFEDFDFFRDSSESYTIQVPMLTSKEVKVLVENMPLEVNRIKDSKIPKGVFSNTEIEHFSRIYKYNPIFNDSEMT